MAKGKSAAALFEVIHKDKRFSRKPPEVAQKPPAESSRNLAAQAVDLWRKRHSDPETWTAAAPNVRIRQPFSQRFAAFSAGWQAGLARSAKSAELVRDWMIRQSSIVFGAVAALIVIAALLLARHWYHPSFQTTPVDVALLAGPAHPAVLKVPTASQGLPLTTPLSPELLADIQQAGDKTAPGPPDANLATPGHRVVNMHYLLMQSYFEEKTATDACNFLALKGIPCTIERGVKGWREDFYQVIGLQGFPRASGPEYLAYVHHVEELGKEFSPKSRYKRFQPQPIKW